MLNLLPDIFREGLTRLEPLDVLVKFYSADLIRSWEPRFGSSATGIPDIAIMSNHGLQEDLPDVILSSYNVFYVLELRWCHIKLVTCTDILLQTTDLDGYLQGQRFFFPHISQNCFFREQEPRNPFAYLHGTERGGRRGGSG